MSFNKLYNSKKIDTVNIYNIETASKQLIEDKKTVFVTGVTGQDGSHMVDYLLKNTDYIIFGGVRRLSIYNHQNIRHINSNRFYLVNFDLTDCHAITRIFEKLKPDYFINFAAQSYVGSSWDFPRQTWQTNSTAVLDILESMKNFSPSCRLYQAGSSEEFGDVSYSPQDEEHPLRPRSPYGASKVGARQLIKVYRESYNLYAIQGWLFNHEGTRRGEEFVTRKITKNIARISKSIENKEMFEPLELGNLYARRDWSDAEDFIEGVWKMLNQDTYNSNYDKIPKDYVFASGETHSIKEFIELAFKFANIEGYWENKTRKPEDETFNYKYSENKTLVLVKINPRFYRPAEVKLLCGDSSKARNDLNWKPKSTFEDLVKKMVLHDLSS